MEQQNVPSTVSEKNLFQDIFDVLKRNILVLIIVTVVATAIGSVWAVLRKPNYIAEGQVLLSMGNRADITSDVNTTHAYKETIIDFCDNGVVVDRANFYFYKYAKGVQNYTLDQFIAKVSSLENKIKSYREENEVLEEIRLESNGIVLLFKEGQVSSSLREATAKKTEALRQQVTIIQKIRTLNANLENASTDAEREAISKDILVHQEWLKHSRRTKESNSSVKPALDVEIPTNEANATMAARYETLSSLASALKTENDNAVALLQQDPLFYVYDKDNRKTEYIQSQNIGIVSYDSTDTENAFAFGVTYFDNNDKLAKEKVRVLILACDVQTAYFFEDLDSKLDDMGIAECSVDISQPKIIVISAVVGLLAGLLIVFAIKALDKTVKYKEEAEKLTGCQVLACIEPQEVHS